MNAIWSMINSLQIPIHIPLFDIAIPKEVHGLNSQLISIATFDLPFIEVDSILGPAITKLPDEGEDPMFTDSAYHKTYDD